MSEVELPFLITDRAIRRIEKICLEFKRERKLDAVLPGIFFGSAASDGSSPEVRKVYIGLYENLDLIGCAAEIEGLSIVNGIDDEDIKSVQGKNLDFENEFVFR